MGVFVQRCAGHVWACEEERARGEGDGGYLCVVVHGGVMLRFVGGM